MTLDRLQTPDRKLDDQELHFLIDLIKQRSGIVLSRDKAYLLESRLTPLARRLGLGSLHALVAALRQCPPPSLLVAVTEAMTTNESSFFRDDRPFRQIVETVIPTLLAHRGPSVPLRIWCAAASTGQEPYSLAICLDEMKDKLRGRPVEILATDLSNEALDRAREGVYSQFEVQRGMPIKKLVRYFEQVGAGWRVRDEIRKGITFRQHNLLDDNTRLGRFDLILIRNVLIYFDVPTKREILRQCSSMLARDGYLILGSTETVLGVSDHLVAVPGDRGLFTPAAREAAPAPGAMATASL